MVLNVKTICLVIAFLFFVLAACGVSARINFVAAGLAFFMLSLLIG
jgi:hypothetical protein